MFEVGDVVTIKSESEFAEYGYDSGEKDGGFRTPDYFYINNGMVQKYGGKVATIDKVIENVTGWRDTESTSTATNGRGTISALLKE